MKCWSSSTWEQITKGILKKKQSHENAFFLTDKVGWEGGVP